MHRGTGEGEAPAEPCGVGLGRSLALPNAGLHSMSLDPALEGYRPTRPWHGQPASPGQVKYLRSFGLEVTRELTKGEAAYLLDRAIKLDAAFPAPATERQQFFLRRVGRWRPGMTKREASRIIAEVKGGAR